MADEAENNGNEKPANISQLTLTFNWEKFELVPTGTVQNYDEALAILGIATRHFEGLLRAAQATQVLRAPMGVPFPLPKRH